MFTFEQTRLDDAPIHLPSEFMGSVISATE
jgi:hypothetical protein